MVGTLLAIAVVMPGPPGQPAKRVSAGAIRAMGLGHPPLWMGGGQARLMARRAAEVRAVRSLAMKLGSGRRTRICGFRYAATAYRSDGTVYVVVEHPMSTSTTVWATTRVHPNTKRRHALPGQTCGRPRLSSVPRMSRAPRFPALDFTAPSRLIPRCLAAWSDPEPPRRRVGRRRSGLR